MLTQILEQTEVKMENVIANFSKSLAHTRASRASSAMLDRVFVDYYGAKTPVNQLASISVPEARMLVIQPYDRSILKDIERAIVKSDIGINPTNDGSLLRMIVPALTEDRRKELVKKIKKLTEEAKIAVRNVRRLGNDELKKIAKNNDVSEDEIKDYIDDIQKLTDKYVDKIDALCIEKEAEIMEV